MAPERGTGAEPGGRARRLARAAVGLALALFLSLLIYGVLTKAPNTGIDESLSQARAVDAPGFELPVLQRGSPGPRLSRSLGQALRAGRVSLDELRGHPLVLNFWASWCIPCREEAPTLERGWRASRGRGVLFVGLNMQDLTEDARGFMRELHNTYLNVRDQSNGVARKWGVTGLPETFFITPRGKVVGHVIGVISPARLRQGIAGARTGSTLGSLKGGNRRPTR